MSSLTTRREFFLFSGFLAAMFFLFVAVGATQTNREIFLITNRLASALPSGVWAHLSLLADATAAIAVLSLFVFKYPNFAVISIWGGALLGIFGQIIKRTADIKRPAAILPDTDFQIIGDPLFAHAFPSGHSLTALLFASCVIFYFRPRLAFSVAIATAGMLIASSRIAVGAHWPLDVLAGGMIGWTGGYLLMTLLRQKEFGIFAKGITLALCCAAVLILPFTDTNLPQTGFFVYIASALLGISAFFKICKICATWRRKQKMNRKKTPQPPK